MACGLAARGHQVWVLHFGKSPATGFYEFGHSGLHTEALALKTRDRMACAVSKSVASWRGDDETMFWAKHLGGRVALRRRLSEIGPDVAVGFMGVGVCTLGPVAKELGLPWIASLHNAPEKLFRPETGKALATQRIILDASAIGFPLAEHFADLAKRRPEREVVLPNPVALPDCVPEAPRERLCLAVGRLVPVKRFDLLISAWAIVAEREPDWRLDILGEGPDHAALSAQIAELGLETSVTLRGPRKDVSAFYQRAAMLLHPARFEGFGLVLAEGMGQGLPVIGSAETSGVRSLVRDGVNGRLLPGPLTAEAMAEAVLELIGAPERLARLQENAPATVADYAPQRAIDRWEAVLRQTVAPSGPAG
ncbi:glycosyl transferase [Roseivivax halodurans JCM 10272]|uniref:Glycosyl transferase n=1 Tax=Roseivivax halodurans JCM 10272 TaxID=1449350 RepID=X7EMR0_9RHOB|nr:glycosyl transferase [Roseivivax halodurans JCM 10272]